MTTRHSTPVDPNPVAAQGPMSLHTAASTDLFTGAFSHTISIPLPPARNGFVPPVSLVYNSDAQGGLMGAGWNLPVPYVARDLSFGMPLYQETKASELEPLSYHIGASSGRLRYVSNPKPDVFLFRPELENGGFLRFFLHWEPRYWEVFDTAGNCWLLGVSPNSRDSEGAHIFAWYVETIKDRHKNQISYTYKKQDGVLYPLRIEYDQGVQLAAYPKVDFKWEHVAERTVCPPSIDVCVDDHRISYRKGFRADYCLRLSQVTVTGYDENSQPESRSYDIAYEVSKSYAKGKMLDGQVTWDALGNISVGPKLSYMGGSNVRDIRPQEAAPGHPSPATSFEYFDVQEDFQQRQEFSWPHDGAAWRQGIHSTQTEVYSRKWLSLPSPKGLATEESRAHIMTKSMLVDMDGDGKLDLLFIDSDGSWRFYHNKGGYQFDSVPVDITLPDGLVKYDALDYTWSIQQTEWQFMGNANRGLGTPIRRLTSEREDCTRQMILDINGNGRADIVFHHDYGWINVCLGEPDGAGWKFGAPVVWRESLEDLRIVTTSLNHIKKTVLQRVAIDLIDMNGDGLLDLVVAEPGNKYKKPAEPPALNVWLNDGDHFSTTPYRITLPKEAYKNAKTPCVSESIGIFDDGYVDEDGNPREMRTWTCKTMMLMDLNGDKIPDLVLNEPMRGQMNLGIPQDEKAFRYAPGTLGGFDTAHYTTIDLSQVPVMVTAPAGDWTDKNGEDGIFIDLNGDGLKDYVLLGRKEPDKVILYVRYNTGHDFLPGYAWEVTSSRGDWVSFPEVEHLTNVDENRDIKGNGPSYMRRALVDIDGDGAVELINIAVDVGGKDIWRIYSHSGPAKPQGCMSGLHSETGMDLGLRYRVTRDDSGSSLPFPKWYIQSLHRKDTITNISLTQEYSPSGAYYDAARREFGGFESVSVKDPTRRLEYSFWNAKESANAYKRGQLRKVGVYNTNILPQLLTETELEHTCVTFPGEERQWVRPSKITNRIMDVNPPLTSEIDFEYETGALEKFGLLKEKIYNRGTSEERRDVYEYCALDPGEDPAPALVRVHMQVRKDRDGLHELTKWKYLYDLKDSIDGCTGITKGDLCAVGEWRNGGWAMSSLEYDAIGRLSKTVSADNVMVSYDYYGNTPLMKEWCSIGKPNLSVYYSGYHALSGKPTKICGPAYRAGHNPKDDLCVEYMFDKGGRVLTVGGTISGVVRAVRGQLAKGTWQKGVLQKNEYQDINIGTSPLFVSKCADPLLEGAIAIRASASRRLGQLRKWTEYYDSFGSLVLLEEQIDKNHFAKLYIDYTPLGQVQRNWARITSKTMGYARFTDDAFALQKSYGYEYDALGRVSRITNPDGTYSRFEFNGNVVIFVDELQHRFEAEMNQYGEVVAKRSWMGGSSWDPVFGGYIPLPIGDLLEATYEYDAAGQLRKAVDPENGIYSYEYGLDGSLKRVKSPVSDWEFDYTASGKLSQVNKSSGASLKVAYDDRGRISVLKEHPGNGDDIGDYREHHFIYDASPDPALGSDEEYAGRLSEVKGIGYRVTYGYNGQGSVDRVALYAPAASLQPLMWVERLYLATGEVLQAHFSTEQVVAYTYDGLGRLSSVKAVDLQERGKKRNQLSTTIQYNPGGQLAQVEGTLCNQGQYLAGRPAEEPFRFTRKYSYGPNGFVSTVDTQVANENPWLLQQWYGPNGQISRICDVGLRNIDHAYHYDGSNRLVLASGYDELADGTKNPSGNIVFQYHKNSALASVAVPNQFIESYSYDNLKQLLISRTSSKGAYSYFYDEDGQRCTEKTPLDEISYKWNGAGNLAQVLNKTTGKTMQFEYGMGVGRWLADRDGQKVYSFDMLEFDEAKNTYRLHTPLPGGIMCTLRTGGAPIICTFMDEHGPAAIYTASGILLEKSEYLPYGEKRILSGGVETGYGFAGQPVEEDIGLTHFGARYYDVRARQWISADLALTASTPDSTVFGLDVLQPFVYASADPASKLDDGGFNSGWSTYNEVGKELFSHTLAFTAASESGVSIIMPGGANPATRLVAAGLSVNSALQTTGGATTNAAIAVGLNLTIVRKVAEFAVRFAFRRGLMYLIRRVIKSMKVSPSPHEILLWEFAKWYDKGLRTAEDFDLATTYGGDPAWKATPMGFWRDPVTANYIEAENRAGMCLERPNIDINRLYPSNNVSFTPLSETAKGFEEYARSRLQKQKEAWGESPSYTGKPTKGGGNSLPDDPFIIPIFGGGDLGGGSGGGDWPW